MRTDAETKLYDIIDMMLRPQGASIHEICSDLGCQRNAFYRYQSKLDAYGIPYHDQGDYDGNTNSKRWFINQEDYRRTIPVRFDHVERMILQSVLGRTRLFDNTHLKARMDSLKKKVNSAVFYDRKKRITTTYYSFKGSISYDGKEDIIDTLFDCIDTRNRATVTYQAAKAKEPKTYEIDPYTLVDHGNGLYVMVSIPKHEGNIRILSVDRIRSLVKNPGVTFTVPESFTPETYLNPSFGIFIEEPIRVVVKFSEDSAIYARERTWGEDQKVEEHEDGTITLSFTAAGLEEIVRWALSFGKGARVLEPPALLDRIRDELTKGLGQY